MKKRNSERPEKREDEGSSEPRGAGKTTKEEGRTVGDGKLEYGKGLEIRPIKAMIN